MGRGMLDSKMKSSKIPSYVPARPYRGSTKPRAASKSYKATSHAGEYRKPPEGGGPGRGPYPWKSFTDLSGMTGTLVGRSSGGGFVQAPAESHLDEFAFYDARIFADDNAISTIDWQAMPSAEVDRIIAIATAGESIIKIRFGDGSEYEYYSTDHERMESLFALLRNSDSPGTVVWSNLIKPQIDYKQTVDR